MGKRLSTMEKHYRTKVAKDRDKAFQEWLQASQRAGRLYKLDSLLWEMFQKNNDYNLYTVRSDAVWSAIEKTNKECESLYSVYVSLRDKEFARLGVK